MLTTAFPENDRQIFFMDTVLAAERIKFDNAEVLKSEDIYSLL
jgi:hypothetical protein